MLYRLCSWRKKIVATFKIDHHWLTLNQSAFSIWPMTDSSFAVLHSNTHTLTLCRNALERQFPNIRGYIIFTPAMCTGSCKIKDKSFIRDCVSTSNFVKIKNSSTVDRSFESS